MLWASSDRISGAVIGNPALLGLGNREDNDAAKGSITHREELRVIAPGSGSTELIIGELLSQYPGREATGQ